MKKRIRRIATYKQMAFETAVRNPDRYIRILKSLKEYEGIILNDFNLLNIVSQLYLIGVVTSDEIVINDDTVIDDIKDKVKSVNNTRNSDGGFPKGYGARFWTYMRTLSELGFVYAQYNQTLYFSNIAKKLINNEIDEQEAYSVQAMKYNRKSPYRNVSNDFNFFKFILKVLIELKKQDKALSYEQFILATFNKDGNVNNFIKEITENTFRDYSSVYNYIVNNYDTNTKESTVTKDYPDVVRRLLIISGFVTIKYSGIKFIQINENKLNYINDLLNFNFSLNEIEKIDSKAFFDKLNNIDFDAQCINLIYKYRKEDKINAVEYTKKLLTIIEDYKIDENLIIDSINSIGSKRTTIEEFNEIQDPLKLEFFISILVALKYGKEFSIRPNYKADHIGKPYSHAPGNKGDIEVFSKSIYWLIEVTLIRNKAQQYNNETTSVLRHFVSNEEFTDRLDKYLSFIAPYIHEDTKSFYDISVISNKLNKNNIYLKPYTTEEFIEITKNKSNLIDMKNYTMNVFEEFKIKLNS